MTAYELYPLDTLSFRDARPMGPDGGHGATWPLPMVVHNAVRTALLRRSGEIHSTPRDLGHHRYDRQTGKTQINDSRIFTTAFRSLRTLGPLPCRARAETLYMPRPMDLVPRGDDAVALMRPDMQRQEGHAANFPVRWLHPVVDAGSHAGKTTVWDWVPVETFIRSLAGSTQDVKLHDPILFDSEHRIGIAIDDNTGATVEHQFYTAEHLRLRPDVSLWFQSALSNHAAQENPCELSAIDGDVLTLGGESRMTHCAASAVTVPEIPRPSGLWIKWVLASHAVFNGGWRPNWVDAETGQVLLKQGDAERDESEDRRTWRMRVRALPPIRASLVAACVGKPIHFSGWDTGWTSPAANGSTAPGGPKPTMLAAPAGSVYYFQADSDADAKALVDALHNRTRSDFLGEKGLGWGFCGRWEVADSP